MLIPAKNPGFSPFLRVDLQVIQKEFGCPRYRKAPAKELQLLKLVLREVPFSKEGRVLPRGRTPRISVWEDFREPSVREDFRGTISTLPP